MDVVNYPSEDLTLDERNLIADYKRAQNKVIPNDVSTDEIWVIDFNQLDYPNLDYVSALRKYLDELEPYMRGLVKAAGLRQLHYDEYYSGKREEEHGHRHWRILMNSIAEDAIEKYNYWKKVHDDELDNVINEFEQLVLAGADERTRQYEREERARIRRERAINKSTTSKPSFDTAIGKRPEPTMAEKQQLKQEQIRISEQKRIDEEGLLNILSRDKTKLVSGKQKKIRVKTITTLTVAHQLDAVGYPAPYFSKFFRAGRLFKLEDNPVIIGSDDEFNDLAYYLLNPYNFYSGTYSYKSKVPEAAYNKYLEGMGTQLPGDFVTDWSLYKIQNVDSSTVDLTYSAIKLTFAGLLTYNDKNQKLSSALIWVLMHLRAEGKLTNPESDIFKLLTAEIYSTYLPTNDCRGIVYIIDDYLQTLSPVYPNAIPTLKLYMANILVNWKYLSMIYLLDYLSHPNFKNSVKYRHKRDPNGMIAPDLDLSCLKSLVDVIPNESPRIIAMWKEAYAKYMRNIIE